MRKELCVRTSTLMLVGFLMLGGAKSSMAASQLDLSVQIFNPVPTSPEHGKSPVKKPIIWQDDYELSFMSSHSDYTLVLCLDGEVVYSVEVPAEATSIVLPSWLEGSYEIQLQTDSNYYFYGYINL